MVWNWHRHKSDMKLKGKWHLGQEMRETKQGEGVERRRSQIRIQRRRAKGGGEERRSDELERGSRNNDKQQNRIKGKGGEE